MEYPQELEEYEVKIKDKHIINLHLSSHSLVGIPETIGKLQGLEKLDLENNRIRSLPETIGKLQKLEKLNLRNNAGSLVNPH